MIPYAKLIPYIVYGGKHLLVIFNRYVEFIKSLDTLHLAELVSGGAIEVTLCDWIFT
jgi:hypothetical protein